MLFRFICPEIMKLDTKVESVMKSPVLTLKSTEPALSAFKLMAFKGISGVAIVDGTNGEILHSTSSKVVFHGLGFRVERDLARSEDILHSTSSKVIFMV
jgi:predicted transcriptional regulator